MIKKLLLLLCLRFFVKEVNFHNQYAKNSSMFDCIVIER
jgi:hypothetical protein